MRREGREAKPSRGKGGRKVDARGRGWSKKVLAVPRRLSKGQMPPSGNPANCGGRKLRSGRIAWCRRWLTACPRLRASVCADVISIPHHSHFSLARRGARTIRCRAATTGSAAMDYSLGTFGDVRLDKRGRRSWNGLSRTKPCACAGWAATGPENSVPGGSLPAQG